MSELKEFPCTKCGACCRLVWSNKHFRDHNMVRPDGACIHLTSDNLCGIQDTRPEVCRFNDLYVNSGLVNIMPVEVFHDNTIEGTCRFAISRAGMDCGKWLPKRNYAPYDDPWVMKRYLSKLGADFNMLYPWPGKQEDPQKD